MQTDTLLIIIVAILLIVVLFLIFREIVTWYWKINRIVRSLENIETDVKFLADKFDSHSKSDPE